MCKIDEFPVTQKYNRVSIFQFVYQQTTDNVIYANSHCCVYNRNEDLSMINENVRKCSTLSNKCPVI